jgi:GT2 family glycosyltransferase
MTPVDVIIVNYNAGALLKDAIDSVLSTPETKVIVVDNASTDDSLTGLVEIPKERLSIVRNEQNKGFATACNQGIQHSNANDLLFLNPDACLPDNTLARLQAVLHSDDNIGMVGGLLLNKDGTEQGGGRRANPTPWRLFVRATGLHHLSKWWPETFLDFHLDKQTLPDEPIEVEAISGACMLVSKNSINKVGLWDEDYFLHVEDLDWCQRYRLANYRIIFVPDAPVIHQKGHCSQKRRVWVEWHKHRGMMRFYRKFLKKDYPGPAMWLVSAGIWTRFALLASLIKINHLLGSKREH